MSMACIRATTVVEFTWASQMSQAPAITVTRRHDGICKPSMRQRTKPCNIPQITEAPWTCGHQHQRNDHRLHASALSHDGVGKNCFSMSMGYIVLGVHSVCTSSNAMVILLPQSTLAPPPAHLGSALFVHRHHFTTLQSLDRAFDHGPALSPCSHPHKDLLLRYIYRRSPIFPFSHNPPSLLSSHPTQLLGAHRAFVNVLEKSVLVNTDEYSLKSITFSIPEHPSLVSQKKSFVQSWEPDDKMGADQAQEAVMR